MVGGEMRVGWELHIRANGFIGWRFLIVGCNF